MTPALHDFIEVTWSPAAGRTTTMTGEVVKEATTPDSYMLVRSPAGFDVTIPGRYVTAIRTTNRKDTT